MSEPRNVKVFISWSGDLSKAVAVALREWLPLLFDRVEPWASDTDIAAGQRGLAQIEGELEGTQFGIVVVTAANQAAPWVNFEAGAMSKTIAGDVDRRVVPLLVDLSGPAQLTGPLAQFQAKVADRSGVLDVLRSLAAVAGIQESVVEARFEAYWERLDQRIASAKTHAAGKGTPAKADREPSDVLDEILLHVRALRSEGEATPSPRGGTKDLLRGRKIKELKEFVWTLAGELGAEVMSMTVSNSGPLEITMTPAKGEQISTNSVEREMRYQLQDVWDGVVSIEWLPL